MATPSPDGKKKANRPNTRAKNLQILRRIIKRAIQEGIVSQAADPFYYFKMPSAPTSKEKLSVDEIDALDKLDLTADVMA